MFDTPMIHSKRPLQKFLRCAETGEELEEVKSANTDNGREEEGRKKGLDRQTDGPLCNFFSAKVKVKFVGLVGRPMDTRCEEH